MDDPRPFVAVAQLSELSSDIYESTIRPYVKAMANQPTADAMTALHPMRWASLCMSDRNPWLAGLSGLAGRVREERRPAQPGNLFVAMERAWADTVTQWWDGIPRFTGFQHRDGL